MCVKESMRVLQRQAAEAVVQAPGMPHQHIASLSLSPAYTLSLSNPPTVSLTHAFSLTYTLSHSLFQTQPLSPLSHTRRGRQRRRWCRRRACPTSNSPPSSLQSPSLIGTPRQYFSRGFRVLGFSTWHVLSLEFPSTISSGRVSVTSTRAQQKLQRWSRYLRISWGRIFWWSIVWTGAYRKWGVNQMRVDPGQERAMNPPEP